MTKLSNKTSEATAETKNGAVVERVKRRPWRDKVRKKARKEALKASREKLKATNEVLPISVADGTSKKKKKKRKKHIIQEEDVCTEGKTEANPVQDGYKKLEAGRFSYTQNIELLYFLEQILQSFQKYLPPASTARLLSSAAPPMHCDHVKLRVD
ncbi:hypothetical protein Y032_0131g1647 [Ancylostoma ceylanicum]|nr:hypothetical protein Y032_0131g1647 [Ancylostoma ceylanicum]